MVKLNDADHYEHLCNVTLSKETYPIAFENKVQELMEECGLSREQAEKDVSSTPIELEIYYEKGLGLFAVEAEATESATIFSPYTGKECEDFD